MKYLVKYCLIFPVLVLLFLSESCQHLIGPEGIPPVPNEPTLSATCDPDTVYFDQHVLPLLLSNCAITGGCHDQQSAEDDVITVSYATVMASEDLVSPGKPNKSELIEVIKETGGDVMPPSPYSRLSNEQIMLLETWISQGAKNNGCVAECDTTAIPTYAANVKPIIQARCLGCHSSVSASGGVNYSTYAGVKTTADNGSLYGSINHDAGYAAMPPSPSAQMPQCEITLIRMWIDEGAPNN